MGKKDKIIAGTQINNLVDRKMYKKLGFIKKKKRHFVITFMVNKSLTMKKNNYKKDILKKIFKKIRI